MRKLLLEKFINCLNATYTTTSTNSGDFAVREVGNTLEIYFEWSNGKEDWRNNFNFPATPYKEMKTKWLCHRGFLKVWKSIEEYIGDKIKDKQFTRIEIAGYSTAQQLRFFAMNIASSIDRTLT